MTQVRRAAMPRARDVVREWDVLASYRDAQLRAGRDISFSKVIAPALVRLCDDCDARRVLDAGCGTGVLTERLARFAGNIMGIDSSAESIAIARSHSALRYEVASIEDYASRHARRFTLIVANMVLMNTPHLRATVRSLAALLGRRGALVFSITHPWFWPEYWGYASASWFSYSRTMAIERPFRISLDEQKAPRSTHIHRPLESYVSELTRAGLTIETLREPRPTPDVERQYPKQWSAPRFLLMRCRLGSVRPQRGS